MTDVEVRHSMPETVQEETAFAAALREAIEDRGLGLGRLVARLEDAGTPVSAATLSYWQSGRSRPGRRTSLETLDTLERILEVEPGELAGQLGPPVVRGRNPQPPTWVELWDEVPAAVSAFEQMGGDHDTDLTRISFHDRVTVGPDRTERTTVTRQIMRAERDGVDRFVIMNGNDDPTCPAPRVRPLDHCTVGRTASEPGSGISASELLLPGPLRRGEFVCVEYEFIQDPPYPPADRYERRRRTSCRQYVLEVQFHPDALPVRSESYARPVDGEVSSEPLELGPEGTLLLVELDGRAGTVGLRWDWSEQDHAPMNGDAFTAELNC